MFLDKNTHLKKIIIPGTVHSISPKAFVGAPNGLSQIELANPALLKDVELPTSVEVVAESFETKDLRLNYDFSVKYKSGHELFFRLNNNKNGVMACDTDHVTKPLYLVIPPKVKVNDNEEYPVTEIAISCFEDCRELYAVFIPDSVLVIRRFAFWCCENLTSVEIPESVLKIEDDAFYSTGLASVFIPRSIISINAVFSGCPNLESIRVDKMNKYYDSRNDCNAIIKTSTNTLIQGCAKTVIPDTVTAIGEEAFYGCVGLKTITIPDSVTEIAYNAFDECPELEEIIISNSSLLEDAEFSGEVKIVTPEEKKASVANIIRMLGGFK